MTNRQQIDVLASAISQHFLIVILSMTLEYHKLWCPGPSNQWIQILLHEIQQFGAKVKIKNQKIKGLRRKFTFFKISNSLTEMLTFNFCSQPSIGVASMQLLTIAQDLYQQSIALDQHTTTDCCTLVSNYIQFNPCKNNYMPHNSHIVALQTTMMLTILNSFSSPSVHIGKWDMFSRMTIRRECISYAGCMRPMSQ